MTEILIQSAVAIELNAIATIVSANTRTAMFFCKVIPAFLALILGVHAYGKFMGWPV